MSRRTLIHAQSPVIHFDIKGSNLMVGRDGKIKIADFGLAQQVRATSDIAANVLIGFQIGQSSGPSKPIKGTRCVARCRHGYRLVIAHRCRLWMAPELLGLKQRVVGGACDIWSLGVTAIELLMGEPPHSREQAMSAGAFPSGGFSCCSFTLTCSLVTLIRDGPPPSIGTSPSGRKFKSDTVDFVARCLRKEPEDRPTGIDPRHVVLALLTHTVSWRVA
jgi:serine/threonine protein kinase